MLGDALKLKISAPPEKGKANKAVQKLLAEYFAVEKKQVLIVSGKTSAHKIIEINGLTDEKIQQKLK